MGATGSTEIVTSGDVELSCSVTGPDEGPLAVCLHGFPDSAATWRHMTPVLVDAGYRVVAPAMRGYAPSSTSPSGTYQTGALAMDAIAVHEQLGGDDRAVVVGHDWGAVAAYGAAGHAPERWSRVIGMAVPPGPAMATALVTDRLQVKRSWYMFLFQHPLADTIVAADDLAFVDMLWSDWSPGYDATDDLTAVRAALFGPEQIAAALGYYRCALGAAPTDPALDDVQAACFAPLRQPSLYLHGRDDGCVGSDIVAQLGTSAGEHVDVAILEHAGHFLHLEQPDAVSERITEFLA